ncbi:MAG: YggN family protein, partial [Luteimonas sp.]|nr:YggN family protein [Luteimonas sp.]
HTMLLFACLALLGGCSGNEPPATQAPGAGSADPALGRTLGKVAEKVRSKMESQNITLDSGPADTKAEITPQGDLLVAGKKVATNEAQRTLLLKYRSEVIAIATAGTDIGMKGADFGLRTAGKALRGVFSGNGDQVEAEIEADARAFEAQARKICEHLSPMLEAQQQLAAQLPEFKPYATMDQSDIDDCLDQEETMQ